MPQAILTKLQNTKNLHLNVYFCRDSTLALERCLIQLLLSLICIGDLLESRPNLLTGWFFDFSQNLEILLQASNSQRFKSQSSATYHNTRYERLRYLFCDTPNLHPLPLFQRGKFLIRTIFIKIQMLKQGNPVKLC